MNNLKELHAPRVHAFTMIAREIANERRNPAPTLSLSSLCPGGLRAVSGGPCLSDSMLFTALEQLDRAVVVYQCMLFSSSEDILFCGISN